MKQKEIADILKPELEEIQNKVKKMAEGKLLEVITFTPRESHILHSRNEGETLKTVGKDIGVTRERIRQIEANAWEKLRINSKKLTKTYDDKNRG